jgi:Uri superfamily endonuclease
MHTPSCVTVGKLGTVTLDKGLYAYVGSAQKNLEKRVQRHMQKQKRVFWHIDYLLMLEQASLTEVFYKEEDKKEECRTAETLTKLGKPVKGFGCSDCTCKSHLIRIVNAQGLRNMLNAFHRLRFRGSALSF